MTERAILFSAPMARAILAGTKTQTRRLVKSPHASEADDWAHVNGPVWHSGVAGDFGSFGHGESVKCPYGAVGDRLWVKETWAAYTGGRTQDGDGWDEFTGKIADMRPDVGAYVHSDGIVFAADGKSSPDRWRPSIFMPRWASRITLEITDVRVERVQVISEDDARSEGLRCLSKDGGITYKYGIPDRDGLWGTDDYGWPWREWEVDPRAAYRKLWESINGAESWASNPWVFAISFKVIK